MPTEMSFFCNLEQSFFEQPKSITPCEAVDIFWEALPDESLFILVLPSPRIRGSRHFVTWKKSDKLETVL
jgi:hypothetical protein